MCRIARSREWSTRIMHEFDSWDSTCFITLTYKDEYLPPNGTLRKVALQQFFKRLRRYQEPEKIRYYACGEYGAERGRPHYHAIIFGLPPTKLTEALISKAWPYGRIDVGTCTYDSARYTADYIFKKYDKKLAEEVYLSQGKEIPFQLVSQGLGLEYALKNADQIIDNLGITIHGAPVGIPRYYVKKLEIPTELRASRSIDLQKKELEKYEKNSKAPIESLNKRFEHRRLKEATQEAKIKLYKKGSL